jgi:hypothetical protein
MGRFCPIGSGREPLEQTPPRFNRLLRFVPSLVKAVKAGGFREEIHTVSHFI